MTEQACTSCGSLALQQRKKQFKDQTQHMELFCGDCGQHIQWVQHVDNALFKMPFGMHKNKLLSEVPTNYIEFMLTKNLKGSIKKRFQQELDSRRK